MTLPSNSSTTPAWSSRLTLLFALSCGLAVANVYYAQPIAGPLGEAVGLAPQSAGLVVTLTQIGYALGLLFIAPLGDLLEKRGLVVALIGLTSLGLAAMGLATNAPALLGAGALIGLTSVAVQVLVPMAADLAPVAHRGRVVGAVQSGLLLGVMLARPVSSFIAELAGWRWMFFLAAALMAALALSLRRSLPARPPQAKMSYGALLASMGRLALTTPVLWRKGFYQFCMFGAFSLFWTAVPLLLASPEYGFSQNGIALFALAGAAGAFATPIAGRLGDAGWSRPGTGAAMLLAALGFVVAGLGARAEGGGLACLVAGALLVDFGVQANLSFGQQAIFSLGAENRARLNSLFIASFFCGGAAGSALGAWIHAHEGWKQTALAGLALALAGFAVHATEWLPARRKADGQTP